MDIYHFKPTYLYIKQHSITGLKYFGKTTRNPYRYKGSGTYWKKHIDKHGRKYVKTLWVSEIYHDPLKLQEDALKLSFEYDIVESSEWANYIPENGLDGTTIFTGKSGSENISHILSVKNKKKETCLKNYGVENPSYSQEVLDKIKETCLKNYGVENPSYSPIVIQKIQNTFIQKYGDHPFKTKQGKEKIKCGMIQKYGVDNPSKLPFITDIISRKTYAKNVASRLYPDLKVYF